MWRRGLSSCIFKAAAWLHASTARLPNSLLANRDALCASWEPQPLLSLRHWSSTVQPPPEGGSTPPATADKRPPAGGRSNRGPLPAAAARRRRADEAAVERLVQFGLEQQQQQQHKHAARLPPAVLASRVRLLLREGLSEAVIRKDIAAGQGSLEMASEEDFQQSVQLLRKLGFTLKSVSHWRDRGPLMQAAHATVAEAVAWLQAKLGDGDLQELRVIVKNPRLLACSAAALEERWRFLQQLLAADDAVLRMVVYRHPPALTMGAAALSDTFGTLAGLLGSREDAVQVLQRSGLPLKLGSAALKQKWDSFLGVAGDAAAVRRAVLSRPKTLENDVSQPAFQRRLQFLERQFGLKPGAALNSYLEYQLTKIGPRVAWARHCSPPGTAFTNAWPFARPDARCMQLCKLPTSGFQQFKREWLASEEGRYWCQYEQEYQKMLKGTEILTHRES